MTATVSLLNKVLGRALVMMTTAGAIIISRARSNAIFNFCCSYKRIRNLYNNDDHRVVINSWSRTRTYNNDDRQRHYYLSGNLI